MISVENMLNFVNNLITQSESVSICQQEMQLPDLLLVFMHLERRINAPYHFNLIDWYLYSNFLLTLSLFTSKHFYLKFVRTHSDGCPRMLQHMEGGEGIGC